MLVLEGCCPKKVISDAFDIVKMDLLSLKFFNWSAYLKKMLQLIGLAI